MRILFKFLCICLTAALFFSACSSDNDEFSTEQTETPPAETSTSVPGTASVTEAPSASTSQAPAATSEGAATTLPDAEESTTESTTAPESTTSAIPDPLPAGEVSIKVFNGSGAGGVAGQLTRNLVAAGYVGLSAANAPERYSASVVYYVSPEYLGSALQIAESIGLIDPGADVQQILGAAVQQLPDPAPFAFGGAQVIVVIGRDQLAASLSAQIAELSAETPSTTADPASSSDSTTSTTSTASTTSTTTTTAAASTLFPPATTIPPRSASSETAPTNPPATAAPSGGSSGGPPALPQIDFGDLEEAEIANIRVTVQDGADEGGELRYQVRRGSVLIMEVLSRVGPGTVEVERYGNTGSTTLFSGAWISFTANRSGIFNVTFTPESTGVEELIFQIEVS